MCDLLILSAHSNENIIESHRWRFDADHGLWGKIIGYVALVAVTGTDKTVPLLVYTSLS